MRTTVLVLGVLWLYALSEGCAIVPALFSNDICMHKYNHFILGNTPEYSVGRFVDTPEYNTITMRLWCTHFGGEKKAKKNKNLTPTSSKNRASSSKQHCCRVISPSTWFFFLKN